LRNIVVAWNSTIAKGHLKRTSGHNNARTGNAVTPVALIKFVVNEGDALIVAAARNDIRVCLEKICAFIRLNADSAGTGCTIRIENISTFRR
jgi:hypothetical protein